MDLIPLSVKPPIVSCLNQSLLAKIPFLRWNWAIPNQCILYIGAGGRTRTGTAWRPRDFKSLVSTNFTTPAFLKMAVYVSTAKTACQGWGLCITGCAGSCAYCAFHGFAFSNDVCFGSVFSWWKTFQLQKCLAYFSAFLCYFVMLPLYQNFNTTATFFFKNSGQGVGLKVRYVPNQQMYYSIKNGCVARF